MNPKQTFVSTGKVLLVDDDIDDQEIFINALQEIDPSIQYEIANNGIETLARLKDKEHIPGIIFLDINMPVMDGFTCLSLLKQDISFDKIPVVVLTTSKDLKDKEKALKLGANHFLTKPHVPSLLISELKNLLEEFHLVA